MASRPSHSRFAHPFQAHDWMFAEEDPEDRAIREFLGWPRPVSSWYGPLDPDGYEDCGGNADQPW